MERAGEVAEQPPRQGEDVLPPLPQGGHRHLHHVEAVEEVLPEPPRADVLLEVAVGGRRRCARRRGGCGSRPPARRPFPEGSEAAGPGWWVPARRSRRGRACRPRRSPPARGCRGRAPVNEPRACPKSSETSSWSDSVGALTVTKGRLGPGGEAVQRPGEHALPGAVLAAEQHRGIRGGRAAKQGQRRLHRRRPGLQQRLGVQPGQAILEGLHPRPEQPSLAEALDHRAELRGGEGLGQVVARPAAHRLHRGVDRGVGGDDHHVELGVLGQQQGQEVEAARYRRAGGPPGPRRRGHRPALPAPPRPSRPRGPGSRPAPGRPGPSPGCCARRRSPAPGRAPAATAVDGSRRIHGAAPACNGPGRADQAGSGPPAAVVRTPRGARPRG